jgi:hypothetical protein
VYVRLSAYEPIETATTNNAPAGSSVVATTASRAEEGTIISDEGTPAGTTPPNASVSAREQRYNELLRAAPPPAPPVQVAEKPSFLDRVVAPIANALGMRPKAQPPQPAAAAPQVLHSQAPPRRAENPTAIADNNAADTQRPAEDDQRDDPDTDVVAPQLFGVQFTPAEVQDGAETVLAVTVQDNRSGVRSVSGVIGSPSGSMQGFAANREPESDRFIARIAIPKDAPSGVWIVKYLTLSDNASNSVTLNAGQGSLPATASFRVTSADADASGPQLRGVYLDKQAMRAGDRNTIFIQADDDKAGVQLVSGVFVSPARAARIGFGCRLGGQGAWECTIQTPVCLDCGVWKLEQIQLQDKANNLATFRQDNQLVAGIALDISSDKCDAAAPVVTSLVLDPTVVSNAEATTITVTATVMDEGPCGVASLSGQAVPPGGIGGQRRYISFGPSADGQTYVGKLEIPQFAAKGLWTIAWIQALDKGHNLRAYSSSEPVVARATFRVE